MSAQCEGHEAGVLVVCFAGTGECKGGGRWADDCLFGGMDMRLSSLYQVVLIQGGGCCFCLGL